MWNRAARALVAKDMRLHGRGVIAVQLGLLALIGLITWAARGRPTSTPAGGATFIFTFNFIIVTQWGEWLVSREKTKGTVAWLRTLPVSDKTIVWSKFLVCSLWCLSLWTSSTFLFARSYFFPSRWPTWWVEQLCLLGFGGLALGGRWRFRQKLGMQIPLLAIVVPLAAVLLSDKAGIPVLQRLASFYSQPTGKAAVIVGLIALYGLIGWLTAHWVSRSETYKLLE